MSTSTVNIKTSHPAIRIKLGKEMSINKKVLHALGNPANILFWWSKNKRVLLIGEAHGITPLSFNVNDRYYATKTGFKIERRKLIQTIMKIAEWRSDVIYAVKGKYITELNMVAFKFDDAVEFEVETRTEADSDV